MGDPKHTLGPWRWLSPDTLVGDHGNRPVVLAAGGGRGGRLIRLEQRDPTSGLLVQFDPQSPDGKLLATSPEMNAALIRLLYLIDKAGGPVQLSMGVQLGSMSWCAKFDEAVDFARETLKKAGYEG